MIRENSAPVNAARPPRELALEDFLGLAAFALGQQFADAQNRRQSRRRAPP